MARMMMDHGAVPTSFFSSAPSPYAVPAQQAPYYAIPHHYPTAPQYVYNPTSAFEYGQSNVPPIFRVMPSQNHHHQHPVCITLPARADVSKDEVSVQEALENALRQKQEPKPQIAQQIPQSNFLVPNAPHPTYVMPEGTMLGQPVHYNGYPVYQMEDSSGKNRSFLNGNQRPGGLQLVNSHGMPIYAPAQQSPDVPVSEFHPYGLPASQPGMRWKLVPVTEPDIPEANGVVPKATSAPLMLLQSPDTDSTSGDSPSAALKLMPESVRSSAPSSKFENPYEQFLSLLLPQLKDGVVTEDSDHASEVGVSPKAPAIVANSVVPESEVEAAAPKSVKVIPVTDPLSDDKRIVRGLTEKVGSVTNTKVGSGSLNKQPKKPSTPVLRPIRLVPSLDFVKKDGRHVARSKEEKQVDLQENHWKTNSQHASKEKEVPVGQIPKEVAMRPDEAGSKMDVAAMNERAKSMEESSNEPSAKKKCFFITDSETAARLIQSVYRGYMVRRSQPLRHLRDISRVKSQLKDYQALAADSSFLEKCKDPVERTKISEGIMNLLLQLDVIQGVDPVVRDIRKFTSKEVLKLQSEVDATMELVSSPSSPQAVSVPRDQTTAMSILDDETKAVDKVSAPSEEPNSAEANENVEQHDAIGTSDHKTEEIVSHQQSSQEPLEQPEEPVEILLRELLSKLSKSEGPGAVDSELITEVVRKLSILEEQQRNTKNANTKCLNEHSGSSAHGNMDYQEESVVAGTRTFDNFGDEILHSLSSALDGIGGETGEKTSLISEPAQVDLENLVEDVAADFVNAVLTLTEDSVQSSVGIKEENLEESKDLSGTKDTELHNVFDAGVALPPQSASGDVCYGRAEAAKPVNSRELNESRPGIAGGKSSSDESSSFPLIEAENRPEDDDEGRAQILRSECLRDIFTHGSSEVCSNSVSGDGKEPASDLGPHEEPSKSSLVAELEAADEATDLVSTKSLANESKVQDEQDADLIDNNSTENDESIEVEGENDVAPEHSFDQYDGSWTCPHSHYMRTRLQSDTVQDAEKFATDVNQEPAPIWDQLPAPANAINQSEIPESVETPENMKVQIPDNRVEVIESPTSVLDAVASMAPAEDVAEIIFDEKIPNQPSITDTVDITETQLAHDSEKEALQLESAISKLQSLNKEGEFFLNDQSLQLESAISNLQSLNNTGQGFLNDLNPANSRFPCRPPSKRIVEEVCIPEPPSLSAEAQRILEDGGCLRDACERLYVSASSQSSVTKHLVEENVVLRRSLRDVLMWSQWQSLATLRLMKMMEKLECELLEVKRSAKKGKLGRKKQFARKNNRI